MRRSGAILALCFMLGALSAAWITDGPGTAQAETVPPGDDGPVLLDFNAPLLNAPLLSDRRSAPSEDSAAKRPPASTDAKKSNPPADEPGLPSLDGPAQSQPSAVEKTELPEKQEKADDSAPSTSSNEGKGIKGDEIRADEEVDEVDEIPAPAAKPKDEPLPPLSEAMKSLRGSVRQTVTNYARQPLSTRENTPANILHACMAFGCDTQVYHSGTTGGRLNGITCLCWNYPCAGYSILRTVDDQIVPRVGYPFQDQPGEFLAVLALSRVPEDYPISIGEKKKGTVEDLVEYEKRNCREGADLSYTLIGLARYCPLDATWENDQGQKWSIARMVQQELDRSGDDAPEGGLPRLLALSYVVDRYQRMGQSLKGPLARAVKYLNKFQDYAWELQNDDGSWHPAFFKYRGKGGSAVDQLRSTGQIVRWLVLAVPDHQLQDARLVKAIGRLVQLLNSNNRRGLSLSASSAREVAARLDAVHALMLYDMRLFQPYDQAEAQTPETQKQPAVSSGTGDEGRGTSGRRA
ncbi:MAG: hypothetical protein JW818_06080 [Pirellulales bacterium]|nr:hypothetical protein [Pirellulales bacterium]